ncbi:type II toxin-antitoxin system RelE/ParE family toxin [Gelidibacter salicanalis]|uniref:type II toxin-antitoxin system RelE/ParE family toxin n=1 Tax=Gelidibacter salicanalis TaxID=291193 RepID=UPI0021D0E0E2|nr:type II toxin-antitoxin system RelE/ParE family toxin [Gelidibacter salicanalis]
MSKDKPHAAKKFKTVVIKHLMAISMMPYQHKKSIYFDDPDKRDLIFNGYTIVFRIKPKKQVIEVFGFIKHQNEL